MKKILQVCNFKILWTRTDLKARRYIVCPTSVLGAWSFLLTSFASNQTFRETDDKTLLSESKTILLAVGKMSLPNIRYLKNFVVRNKQEGIHYQKYPMLSKQ